MIVLDANILIRAALGKRVREILEKYSGREIHFYAPESAYAEAEEYLPSILRKKGNTTANVAESLSYLQRFVEPIGRESYEVFEEDARRRLRNRDEEDWHVLAAALALNCPVWTEDTDFFGTGMAVWNSARIEIFLISLSGSKKLEEI